MGKTGETRDRGSVMILQETGNKFRCNVQLITKASLFKA